MFDVVVLGGGPAGMSAALRAHELGADVALIERGRLGGAAFTDGVIVTRTLAQAAAVMRDAIRAPDYGLKLLQPPAVDFPRLRQRVAEISDAMRSRKSQRLLALQERITLYTESGEARFADAHTIRLGSGEQVQGKAILICVGGSPRRAFFPGFEHTITHRGILNWDKVPASVAIVGAGATGCHTASILNAFGAKVTLLESAARILPTEDEAVSQAMGDAFRSRGIEVVTGFNNVQRIEKAGKRLKLTYTAGGSEHEFDVEAVVLAIGWPGNAVGLGLDTVGIRTTGANYIETNDYLQTSVKHIYAAGDITGRALLVHSASYQGAVAAENALQGTKRLAQPRALPRGTFTEPEYAGVGLTEEQARELYDIETAVVPYTDLDRAVIDGRTTGFCKLIANRATGAVLGAHIVGEQAKEMIALVAADMGDNLNLSRLVELELAYPSYNAIIGMAARRLSRELDRSGAAVEWQTFQAWFDNR